MTDNVRKEIAKYARAIEEVLSANDDEKGARGWTEDDVYWLSLKLVEEVGELARLVIRHQKPGVGARKEDRPFRLKVRQEAGDIGALAMMIADNLGALDEKP
jgi:NTP pyrophosphatase (non-canonical NTP hydrolase)